MPSRVLRSPLGQRPAGRPCTSCCCAARWAIVYQRVDEFGDTYSPLLRAEPRILVLPPRSPLPPRPPAKRTRPPAQYSSALADRKEARSSPTQKRHPKSRRTPPRSPLPRSLIHPRPGGNIRCVKTRAHETGTQPIRQITPIQTQSRSTTNPELVLEDLKPWCFIRRCPVCCPERAVCDILAEDVIQVDPPIALDQFVNHLVSGVLELSESQASAQHLDALTQAFWPRRQRHRGLRKLPRGDGPVGHDLRHDVGLLCVFLPGCGFLQALCDRFAILDLPVLFSM